MLNLKIEFAQKQSHVDCSTCIRHYTRFRFPSFPLYCTKVSFNRSKADRNMESMKINLRHESLFQVIILPAHVKHYCRLRWLSCRLLINDVLVSI